MITCLQIAVIALQTQPELGERLPVSDRAVPPVTRLLDMAELWFPVPPLAGDVVLLRPCGEADVPGIVLAFSDPVIQRVSWRNWNDQ
jgi:hypothetical protein